MRCLSGGIRTIPPGFTRGLDFGPLADGAEGQLLDEEEAVEVTPIYRPMVELTSDGRTTAVLVRPLVESLADFDTESLPTARSDCSSATSASTRLEHRGAAPHPRAPLILAQHYSLLTHVTSASRKFLQQAQPADDRSWPSATGRTSSTSIARSPTSASSYRTWRARCFSFLPFRRVEAHTESK